MAMPNISFLTLADLCDRWGVKPPHIGALALDQKLVLSIGLSGVRAEVGEWQKVDIDEWQRLPEGWQYLTGIFDLKRNDAWSIIKHGPRVIDSVMPVEPDGYIEIRRQEDLPEFVVAPDDLLIRREEVERFEANNAPAPRDVSAPSLSRGGPGAPPKYDWESFWIETCRRLHDDGPPSTQKEMVLNLLGWFDDKGAAVPDESTVKKKVSKLWKALGLASQSVA
ncbi:hypothetical protein [Paramagnetospirillum marisnigri]|nr:hypothetical protein [Paramagnetospirillum marisnigri]